MAADEKSGMGVDDFIFHPRSIPARVTTDMLHKNVHLFAGKMQFFRKDLPDIPAVDIAKNSPNWKAALADDPVGNFNAPKIAGMPYFVACFKMLKNRFV